MTRRAVLDMDVGIDDAIAILYLAAHTDVDIVALGTVHGNGYTDTDLYANWFADADRGVLQ